MNKETAELVKYLATVALIGWVAWLILGKVF